MRYSPPHASASADPNRAATVRLPAAPPSLDPLTLITRGLETVAETRFEGRRDDGFVQGFLQAYFLPMDPDNLLTQAAKWRAADVSLNAGGDMEEALGRITAAVTVVAFTGDLFFPPEDISADAGRIPGAKFVETGSVWGHFTMFNLREQDTAAIDQIYAEALAG